MKFQILPEDIVKKFLIPIGRITDSCKIYLRKDNIYSIVNQDDLGLVLYCKYNNIYSEIDKEEITLNIGSIKKLCQILQSLNGNKINLNIESNNINLNDSSDFNFKYHLFEDDVIKKVSVNLDKINNLTFDFDFILTIDTIQKIIKTASFINEANKIYLYTKNNILYGELNDKELSNTDSMTLKIADSYNGPEIIESIPIKSELFNLFTSVVKYNIINVKINTKNKILMFDIQDKDFLLKYIATSLIK